MKKVLENHTRVSKSLTDPMNTFIKNVENFLNYCKLEIKKRDDIIEVKDTESKKLKSINTTLHTSLEKVDIIASKIDTITSKIEKIENNKTVTSNCPTYSQIASTPPNIKREIVLVKAKVANLTPNKIKEMICNAINPNEVDSLCITVNKTNVVFELQSEGGKRRLIKLINNHEHLKNTLDASEPNPKCPTIILRNIDYSTPESDLISNIIERNNIVANPSHFRILFTIKKKYYYNAVICISPHILHILQSLPNAIITGWTCSHLEETFLTGHCGRCFSFAHRTKDCNLAQSTKRCRNCGDDFSTVSKTNSISPFAEHIRNCTNNPTCKNCLNHPRYSSVTQHHPDTQDCPIYQSRLHAIMKQICRDKDTVVLFQPNKNSSTIPNSSSSIGPGNSNQAPPVNLTQPQQ